MARKAPLKPVQMASVEGFPRISQKGEKFDPRAVPGRKAPKMMRPKAPSLRTVSVFWITAPQRTPTALAAVRIRIKTTGTVVSQWLSGGGLMPSGSKLKKNWAEITARAAMLAELMMRRFVQPKRKAVSFPKDSRR